MSDIAIRVNGLGKQYRIGQSQRYKALRDTITDTLAAPFRWLKNGSKPNGSGPETFWALKDVNFEVKRGEVIGVIGRNGAGKSTLLKVLSRITEPTEGHAEIHGRVGSLLEVGTGFHPELTGRENIFLNGAILGMKRAEILRKFDEIVAFSEIEKFIDTPAKHYSSGMYMRLAFAVAAHLEPEILIIDEVLAVGDVEFQKKCIGRMRTVAEHGRTVLFVSHNMQAVSLLCSSVIWLKNGAINDIGSTNSVVGRYLSDGTSSELAKEWGALDGPRGEFVQLQKAWIVKGDAKDALHTLDVAEPFEIHAHVNLHRSSLMHVSFHIYNENGVLVFATGNFNDPAWHRIEHTPGTYACSCNIPANLMNCGTYSVHIFISRYSDVLLQVTDVLRFELADRGENRGDWTGEWLGVVRPILKWKSGRVNDAPSEGLQSVCD